MARRVVASDAEETQDDPSTAYGIRKDVFFGVALTRLTYAVAPAFAAKGSGTIINISSAVAIAVVARRIRTLWAKPQERPHHWCPRRTRASLARGQRSVCGGMAGGDRRMHSVRLRRRRVSRHYELTAQHQDKKDRDEN